MIKLIIADDHVLIRNGLKKLFAQEIDIEVIADTNDPFDVPNLVKQYEFDILILDLNFPKKSGLDLLAELKIINPKIQVLILSMHPEERYALRTIKAGAMGYISKESDLSIILNAVRKIHSGRKYISPEFSDILLNNFDKNSTTYLHENLSDREYQVLLMMAQGVSQTDISNQLSLSRSTVNTYRSRILEKLKLKSNAEVIHYAIENNLIN